MRINPLTTKSAIRQYKIIESMTAEGENRSADYYKDESVNPGFKYDLKFNT